MMMIAGGILLAIFILMVLIGLWLTVRDVGRFTRRFVGANGKLVLALALLALVALYVGWLTRSHEVEVSASSPGVVCTGQCVYR